jgi:uncharacterized RDD family membrane protein YckC
MQQAAVAARVSRPAARSLTEWTQAGAACRKKESREQNRGAVSTSPQISPAWKQEVNRRLAEHRGRKSAPASGPRLPSEAPSGVSQRALQAAARVAARYANAPSYSEVLAAEARAALRAAEAASRAALDAQAAAQSLLAGIEAAQAAEPVSVSAPLSGSEPVESVASAESASAPSEAQADPCAEMEEQVLTIEPIDPVSIRWDPELPVRPADPSPMYASRGGDLFEAEWWKLAPADRLGRKSPHQPAHERIETSIEEPVEIEVVEPAQPIPANLIEFPRELVAARRARPRLAEAPYASAGVGAQLSIFEVDPAEILPAKASPGELGSDNSSAAQISSASSPAAAAWTAPAWSGMELEAQPRQEACEPPGEPAPGLEAAPPLAPAPASLRLMASIVDGALIAGSLIGAALTAATHMTSMPSVRTAEIGAAAGLLIAAAFYYALFFTLARATPGMLYAQLRLSTFDGRMPARAQRWTRLAAMLVSVLPVGLGFAWSIFDEDQLCWHDRLSRTYVCRR